MRGLSAAEKEVLELVPKADFCWIKSRVLTNFPSLLITMS